MRSMLGVCTFNRVALQPHLEPDRTAEYRVQPDAELAFSRPHVIAGHERVAKHRALYPDVVVERLQGSPLSLNAALRYSRHEDLCQHNVL